MNATDPNSAPPLDTRGGSLATFAAFAVAGILAYGLAWPLVTATLGAWLFPDAARGSLVERDGAVVGSMLVAQPFADPRYLVPRPSAAGYAGQSLSGSNWAPSNTALRERIAADAAAVAQREGIAVAAVPVELVTASGSGIDPHLSPQAAALQVPRIARARGMDEAAVRALLAAQVEGRQWGVFGQPRVNVLAFNLALDAAPAR